MNKIIKTFLSLGASFAIFMVSCIATFGCFGPGYCPDLPKNADKLAKF